MTFVDIAVYFSAEEWKNLEEWQKELYNNLVKENYEALLSLGKCPCPPLLAGWSDGCVSLVGALVPCQWSVVALTVSWDHPFQRERSMVVWGQGDTLCHASAATVLPRKLVKVLVPQNPGAECLHYLQRGAAVGFRRVLCQEGQPAVSPVSP